MDLLGTKKIVTVPAYVVRMGRLREGIAMALGLVLGALCHAVVPGFFSWAITAEAAELDEPIQLRLERLEAAGAGLSARSMSGAEVAIAEMAAGFFHGRDGCQWLYGGVRMEDEMRSIVADSAVVRRNTVQPGISAAVFVDQVELEADEIQASGDALWMETDEDFVLDGSPVIAKSRPFEIQGDRMSHRAGLVEVEGSVWANAADVDTPLGGDKVYAESPRALIDQAQGWWRFEGGARAWSGSDLITADAIEGSSDGSLMAEGGVDLEVVLDVGNLDVASDRLSWRDGVAIFEGSVRGSAGGHKVSCRRLEVRLSGAEVQSLECTGDDLTVSSRGAEVSQASRFRWDSLGAVEVEGCPALLERDNGDFLAGRLFMIDLETETVIAFGA